MGDKPPDPCSVPSKREHLELSVCSKGSDAPAALPLSALRMGRQKDLSPSAPETSPSHVIGEGPHRSLGQAYGLARLLLGGVTTRRLILPYKGIPGDAVSSSLSSPLFHLFLLLVNIKDVLASVLPRLPIILPLRLVLLCLPPRLIRSTVHRPHGLAPRQRR